MTSGLMSHHESYFTYLLNQILNTGSSKKTLSLSKSIISLERSAAFMRDMFDFVPRL